jgi:hemolysin activation/secretion protein
LDVELSSIRAGTVRLRIFEPFFSTSPTFLPGDPNDQDPAGLSGSSLRWAASWRGRQSGEGGGEDGMREGDDQSPQGRDRDRRRRDESRNRRSPRSVHVVAGLLMLIATLMIVLPARAQLLRRDEPLDVPDFEPDRGARPGVLPPIPEEIRDEFGGPTITLPVRRFRFSGNEAVDDAQLERIAEPYVGRALRYADLESLRTELTRYYVSLGFVNSGAHLPIVDESGLGRVEITEGEIGKVQFRGLERLPEFFVSTALLKPTDGPLNLFVLEDRVRLLRRDPRIEDLSVHVQATDEIGVADLRIDVGAAVALHAELQAANQQSPGVGAEFGEVILGHYNLLGWSDHLEIRGRLSEGLREFLAEYDIPVSSWQTRLVVGGRVVRADVVEDPFDDLNLESEQDGAWLRLEQPLFESLRHHHELSLEFEWKRSDSTIFGDPLDVVLGQLGDPVVVAGRSEAFLFRARHRYSYRGRRVAFAVSNMLTRSVDVPGTTARTPNAVGNEFLAWLGQASGALRLDPLDSELFARFEIQIASSRVLPFEQLSVGGFYTVRGYRENQLVRDNGFSAGIEWRVPVWSTNGGNARAFVFPFFDFGRAWRKHSGDEAHEWIYSSGVGARLEAGRRIAIDLAWANRFQDSQDGLSGDLQDSGIHFRVILRWPG